MRTLIIIVVGFAALGACAWLARALGSGVSVGAKLFIPLWFAAAAINMGFGVIRAGYSVREELPIFGLIFVLPAALALFIWRKYAS